MFPIKICFNDVRESDLIWDISLSQSIELSKICDQISLLVMTISARTDSRLRTKFYEVEIEITYREGSGSNLGPKVEQNNADLYIAVQNSFNRAKKALIENRENKRKVFRIRRPSIEGEIIKLFPSDGYGLIRSEHGQEICFHRHSVSNSAFSRLRVGDKVRFSEEIGHEKIQAMSVVLLQRADQERPNPFHGTFADSTNSKMSRHFLGLAQR